MRFGAKSQESSVSNVSDTAKTPVATTPMTPLTPKTPAITPTLSAPPGMSSVPTSESLGPLQAGASSLKKTISNTNGVGGGSGGGGGGRVTFNDQRSETTFDLGKIALNGDGRKRSEKAASSTTLDEDRIPNASDVRPHPILKNSASSELLGYGSRNFDYVPQNTKEIMRSGGLGVSGLYSAPSTPFSKPVVLAEVAVERTSAGSGREDNGGGGGGAGGSLEDNESTSAGNDDDDDDIEDGRTGNDDDDEQEADDEDEDWSL